MADKPCESVTLIVKVWFAPATVGVPCTVTELVVLLLRDNPVGPATIAHEYGPTPPVMLTGALYAPFTFPAAIVVVEICGGVTKLTVKIADFVASVTDVAVKVAIEFDATVAGALYVMVVDVEPLREPRPVTLDQLTPA